ncbi:MAG: hypothetical protein JWQ57_4915 [Mucilaginibacter sp.]|nr:hypothetical protein [Mucilaginibacter sp.]
MIAVAFFLPLLVLSPTTLRYAFQLIVCVTCLVVVGDNTNNGEG